MLLRASEPMEERENGELIAKRSHVEAVSDSIELTGSQTRSLLPRRGNISLHIEGAIERLLHRIQGRIRGAIDSCSYESAARFLAPDVPATLRERGSTKHHENRGAV